MRIVQFVLDDGIMFMSSSKRSQYFRIVLYFLGPLNSESLRIARNQYQVENWVAESAPENATLNHDWHVLH